MSKAKRLILVIDFDNDVGKLGVKTPVVGYEDVFRVANEYALTYPKDSDLNVLFASLKLHRDLNREGVSDVEVALIAGDSGSFTKAGIKVSKELDKVISLTNCNEAIVVVDSAEDEFVLPIVQSKINIVGIERVVVEQLRGVEETYILLGRYLRKILEERRFSKVFLGLPGLLILVYALLSIMDLTAYATPAISLLLASFLLFKGFGVDEFISRWWRLSPVTRISLVLSALSMAMTGVMFYISLLSRNFRNDAHSIVVYAGNTLPYLIISFTPLIVARLTLRVIKRSIKVWRDLITLATFIVFYQLLSRITEILSAEPITSIQQVVLALNRYQVVSTFFMYVIVIMSISAVLYVVEKKIA